MIDPPHVALYEPEIPGNFGNIARLCAATGCPLHLIGRLGFNFRHPDARRAGMDYWQRVELQHHVAYADFRSAVAGRTVWMLTTRAEQALWEVRFQPGDVLLLGPESRGLPDDLLASDPARAVRIPMRPGFRSLNIATSAGVAVYEALRQLGWSPAEGGRPEEDGG